MAGIDLVRDAIAWRRQAGWTPRWDREHMGKTVTKEHPHNPDATATTVTHDYDATALKQADAPVRRDGRHPFLTTAARKLAFCCAMNVAKIDVLNRNTVEGDTLALLTAEVTRLKAGPLTDGVRDTKTGAEIHDTGCAYCMNPARHARAERLARAKDVGEAFDDRLSEVARLTRANALWVIEIERIDPGSR